MQIRLMTKDDASDIADVLNHAIGHSTAHFGTVPTDSDDVLEEWHAAGETYPWLIATTDDGDFIGFAKGGAWKSRSAYRWTVESGIYLVEGSQGIGAGKALYTKLFDILALQGFRVVFAGVSLPNPASEGLHASMGMEAVGDFAPAGYKFGKWIEVRYYQLHLGELDAQAVPGTIRAVTSVWEELQVSDKVNP